MMFCIFAIDILFSSSECSALYCASSNGSTAVCELLIASKADVNARGWCAGRIGGWAFVFKMCYYFCVVLCFFEVYF